MTNPLADHLLRTLRLAEDARLSCLVIGGHAVIYYGVPRFTRDIDFAIPEQETEAWKDLLEAADYKLFHATESFAQYADNTRDSRPDIDLMLFNASTWDKLHAESVHHALDEVTTATFPCPLHLLAMKLHASADAKRAETTSRDWDDVVALCQSQNIDPSTGLAHDLVLRYADQETLDRLLQAVQS